MSQQTDTSSKTSDEDELRRLVSTAGAILHDQGLVDYLGHCSVRVPGTDRVIIKPKFSPDTPSVGSVDPADLLILNLDGEVLAGSLKPPAEWRIHTSIYRARPDISAVVHTHQLAATLMGLMESTIEPILHIPAILTRGGDINLWRCAQLVTSDELGDGLVQALGQASFCHMQGHGIVSVSSDLRVATVAAIALEQLAEANLRIRQAGGTPHAISDDDLKALQESAGPIEGRWAYYQRLLPSA